MDTSTSLKFFLEAELHTEDEPRSSYRWSQKRKDKDHFIPKGFCSDRTQH
jgi:hypothetical protein